MEFNIKSTIDFADVVADLSNRGYEVYDLDSEDLPLEGKIEIGSIEQLVYLHNEIGEELIITDEHGQPTIEVYNHWRE